MGFELTIAVHLPFLLYQLRHNIERDKDANRSRDQSQSHEGIWRIFRLCGVGTDVEKEAGGENWSAKIGDCVSPTEPFFASLAALPAFCRAILRERTARLFTGSFWLLLLVVVPVPHQDFLSRLVEAMTKDVTIAAETRYETIETYCG